MNYTGYNEYETTFLNGVDILGFNQTHTASNFINSEYMSLNDTGCSNDNSSNYYRNNYVVCENDNTNMKTVTNDGNAMDIICKVDKINVLQHLINTLDGKDKLAKTLKYLLDLIRYILSFESSTIKKNRWVSQMTKNLIKKLTFVSIQLTTYRYILRFGNSPFLIIKFIQKCKSLVLDDRYSDNINEWIGKKLVHLITKLFKASLFKELFNIYFSICDEMMLLNRFQVWKHPKLEKIISKHAVYSWQLDIFFNLKDNVSELQRLRRKSLEYTIEKNIREVDNNLYHNHFNSDGDTTLYLSHLNALDKKLIINKRRQRLLRLNILRLLFDGLANSTDLFKLKVSLGAYSSLLLCSSIVSLIKLWIEAKQKICNATT